MLATAPVCAPQVVSRALATWARRPAMAFQLSGDQWHHSAGFLRLERKERVLLVELARRRPEVRSAVVVGLEPRPSDRVSIGSVASCPAGHGPELVVEIVGVGAGDPERHIVSYDSPIAQALRGRRVGECILLGRAHMRYEIREFLQRRPS